MKHNLLIPKTYLLPIAILGFVTVLIGAVFKITHWNISVFNGNFLFAIGWVLSFIAWIVVLMDVIKNKTKNAVLWIIFLILFGNITSIIYLFKRNN